MGTEIFNAKSFFDRKDVKSRFFELFMNEKNANIFIASVLQVVSNNEQLIKAEPVSVYQCAITAAALGLTINNSLGLAYIVPYNDKKTGKQLAQFQIGYKGFIQLAQRSAQFKHIAACATYTGDTENSIKERLLSFIPSNPTGNVTGYVSYFKLINGFEASLALTIEQLSVHGKRYSQTFKKGYGLWETDFEAMAIKTVIKLLLSKKAPLSIELQKAVLSDQSIIIDADNNVYDYIDNDKSKPENIDINDLKSLFELKKDLLDASDIVYIENSLNNNDVSAFYKIQKKLSEL